MNQIELITLQEDIITNGELMRPTITGDRYALPGSQTQGDNNVATD